MSQSNYGSQPVPLKPQSEPIKNVGQPGSQSEHQPTYTDVPETAVSGGMNNQ